MTYLVNLILSEQEQKVFEDIRRRLSDRGYHLVVATELAINQAAQRGVRFEGLEDPVFELREERKIKRVP